MAEFANGKGMPEVEKLLAFLFFEIWQLQHDRSVFVLEFMPSRSDFAWLDACNRKPKAELLHSDSE